MLIYFEVVDFIKDCGSGNHESVMLMSFSTEDRKNRFVGDSMRLNRAKLEAFLGRKVEKGDNFVLQPIADVFKRDNDA